jgi:prevent-host-death family protein
MKPAPLKSVPAGEFKAHCLHLMAQVQSSGIPIIVTKRGKPVVRLVPAEAAAEPKFFYGVSRGQAKITGDILAPLPLDLELEKGNLD